MLLSREHRIPSAEMQISVSKTTASVVVKKAVRFYEVVSIRSTTHYRDMTSHEIASAWFSRSEMNEIKRNMAIEIKHMTLGKPFPEGTTRGLEFRTREGSNRRKANKLNSIHAVLDEQDVQLMRGECSPEALRSVYLEHSLKCLSESQSLAKDDEIEVLRFAEAEGRNITGIESEDCDTSEEAVFFRRLFAKKRALMKEIKLSQPKEL